VSIPFSNHSWTGLAADCVSQPSSRLCLFLVAAGEGLDGEEFLQGFIWQSVVTLSLAADCACSLLRSAQMHCIEMKGIHQVGDAPCMPVRGDTAPTSPLLPCKCMGTEGAVELGK